MPELRANLTDESGISVATDDALPVTRVVVRPTKPPGLELLNPIGWIVERDCPDRTLPLQVIAQALIKIRKLLPVRLAVAVDLRRGDLPRAGCIDHGYISTGTGVRR